MLLTLGIVLQLLSFSQDTIIDRGIYQSYYSYSLQQPMYVKYVLWKGGGECSRSKFRFINDTELAMVDNSEYTRSGFDRGHLANAEDFAYDCVKDELTFRYYNCLPQTPNLNRGPWKVWETTIRQESQKDSLLIITGGIWTGTVEKGIQVPTYCWKVVQSLSTLKVTHVLLFTNKINDSVGKEITLAELEKMLKYQVPIRKKKIIKTKK